MAGGCLSQNVSRSKMQMNTSTMCFSALLTCATFCWCVYIRDVFSRHPLAQFTQDVLRMEPMRGHLPSSDRHHPAPAFRPQHPRAFHLLPRSTRLHPAIQPLRSVHRGAQPWRIQVFLRRRTKLRCQRGQHLLSEDPAEQRLPSMLIPEVAMPWKKYS